MSSRYNEEFREEAVRLVVVGKVSTSQVAKDLGISVWTLRGWLKNRREKSRGPEVVRPESLAEENRRLKREVAVLRQEREILKRAAAYFAREQL